jgi:hypothetical protein
MGKICSKECHSLNWQLWLECADRGGGLPNDILEIQLKKWVYWQKIRKLIHWSLTLTTQKANSSSLSCTMHLFHQSTCNKRFRWVSWPSIWCSKVWSAKRQKSPSNVVFAIRNWRPCCYVAWYIFFFCTLSDVIHSGDEFADVMLHPKIDPAKVVSQLLFWMLTEKKFMDHQTMRGFARDRKRVKKYSK